MAATTNHASLVTLALSLPTCRTSRETLESMSVDQLHMFLTSHKVPGYPPTPDAEGSKGRKSAADNGTTTPGAVDYGKGNTPPATTLATATVAQLIAELVARHATDAALDTLGNAVGNAIDAARSTLSMVDTPTVKAVPVAPTVEVDAPKATAPAAVAAHAVKPDAAKQAPKAKAKPDSTAKASKPTCKGTKADGTPCKSTICGENGHCNTHKRQAAKPTAPKAKAEPSDPIVPGVFDATGKPLTVSQVRAALEKATAPAKKAA